MPVQDQYDPLQQGQRRRGLFGGRARGILRREDGDPGTALNYFLFGLDGVQGMRDSRMQRDLFNNRVRSQKIEEGAAESQRAALETAIAQLPADQQAWARLNPEAFVESQLRAPPASYGDLERIDGRLGQRNRLTGQYDWAPQVANGGQQAPPAGYGWQQDGSLAPIPGGPADIRANEAGRAQGARLDSSARSLENAIGVLQRAEGMVSNNSAGIIADRTRQWGLNQDATNLNSTLEPVRAILSFENLAEMRRNSETGGALGSIAVRELDLLGSTIRDLNTAQSPDQLRLAIRETRDQLARTLAAVRAAQNEIRGSSPAQGGNDVRVIELDPQ